MLDDCEAVKRSAPLTPARQRLCSVGVTGHLVPTCHQQLQFRCGDGTCIPQQSVCDGRLDCQDATDEQSCSPLRCKEDEFTCSNARCLPRRFLCDGEDHCGDGSDEASCQQCAAFSCGPADVCLSRKKVCDGRPDCRDSRDESPERCAHPGPHGQMSGSCGTFEFDCGDGECISQSFRCDNMSDCSDGSDEKNCDHDACKVNRGGCSHGCVNLPVGFMCVCPENMKLLMDNQCEEIDSCLERDVCDQICVGLNDNQTCRCHKDYRMDHATGECRVKGGEAQLVLTSSTGLLWKNISGDGFSEPVPWSAGRGPVTASASERTLYWAPRGQGAIFRLSMGGKPAEPVLLMKTRGTVTGLALDWIHRLLYWTSTESGSVHIGLLDGLAQRPLVTGLDRPSALAVDPLHRLLFWAQCGSSAKIERAGLDGRDRKSLVTHLLRHPVALTLDVARGLLYWLDQGTKAISRVSLDGLHRKTVVESNGYLDRPFGLAVFEGFVYWSEDVTRSVCRADKHNGRKLQVLFLDSSSPGHVVIVQPALQPEEPTPCGNTGKVCPGKCTVDLTPSTPAFHCAPPEGKQGEAKEIPAISRTASPSAPSDPVFAGILSLVVFLSVLLMGTAVWWWRDVLRPRRPLTQQSISLNESQDPLIIQGACVQTSTCPHKETLLKPNRDGE